MTHTNTWTRDNDDNERYGGVDPDGPSPYVCEQCGSDEPSWITGMWICDACMDANDGWNCGGLRNGVMV